MKVLYIEAKKKTSELSSELNKNALKLLPERLFIAYSIQYKALACSIKRELESLGCDITGFKQVLGCTKLYLNNQKKQASILLIGSGRFHALNLILQTDTPIYIYTEGKISRVDEEEIKKLKQKRRAALVRFLDSSIIGILASTKPGQNRLKEAIKIKKQLKSKGKSVNLFISDNINLSELENFKIDCWVNTACPGLALDSPKIINIDEISSLK